ncbi:hypothetical protein CF161_17879 [Pseudomonas sp. CF161]|nr:hypothetical protein CF161_17879 [Pseudomonas sp. CF161]
MLTDFFQVELIVCRDFPWFFRFIVQGKLAMDTGLRILLIF